MSILLPDTTSGTPIESVLRQVAALRADVANLQRIQRQNSAQTQETWNGVGYQGGWSNPGISGYTGAGYFKEPTGLVNLRGLAGGPTLTANVYQTMFTLPSGYRPDYRSPFLTAISQAGNASGAAIIVVFPDGQVQVGTAFTGAVTYVALDVVRFKAT